MNLDKLKAFLTKVFALFPNGKSASGLTYQEILTTNFYNAASAMVYGTKDTTPLQYWNEQYADDTLVTESQAYKATRDAIWVLLQEYGVPSNNLTRKSLDVVHNPLSLRLLDGANANEVLRTPVPRFVPAGASAWFPARSPPRRPRFRPRRPSPGLRRRASTLP